MNKLFMNIKQKTTTNNCYNPSLQSTKKNKTNSTVKRKVSSLKFSNEIVVKPLDITIRKMSINV